MITGEEIGDTEEVTAEVTADIMTADIMIEVTGVVEAAAAAVDVDQTTIWAGEVVDGKLK